MPTFDRRPISLESRSEQHFNHFIFAFSKPQLFIDCVIGYCHRHICLCQPLPTYVCDQTVRDAHCTLLILTTYEYASLRTDVVSKSGSSIKFFHHDRLRLRMPHQTFIQLELSALKIKCSSRRLFGVWTNGDIGFGVTPLPVNVLFLADFAHF